MLGTEYSSLTTCDVDEGSISITTIIG
jgi:hypothetical protein